jgi:hypothetical protein
MGVTIKIASIRAWGQSDLVELAKELEKFV